MQIHVTRQGILPTLENFESCDATGAGKAAGSGGPSEGALPIR
ncbi:hypothetical protein CLOHYLEM_06082 [[Clostridium] hylemonae DSM 15053]|uniref:Uncharacterized protein n=1 Tax=[Clostridium] hylemonae DSM 15053 TaxID=553973 RepID=C0C1R2_9FIRM|nr:hypothetical protein CLOHYLEM_06082 [[Clostridium] hylemonae DSM 15053]